MNVTLLEFDCLPARLLGAYGNETACTPNFDRLAESGVVFDGHSAGTDPSLSLVPAPVADELSVEEFSLELESESAFGMTFSSLPMVRLIHQWKEVVCCRSTGQRHIDHIRLPGIVRPWFACDELWPEHPDLQDRDQLDPRLFGDFPEWPADFSPAERELLHESLHAYVEMLDAALGMILDTLEENAPDALFLLTARRGIDLGEAVLRGDLNFAGPEMSHVPLFLMESSIPECRRRVLSTDADVAPTLYDWLHRPRVTTTDHTDMESPHDDAQHSSAVNDVAATSTNGISLIDTIRNEQSIREHAVTRYPASVSVQTSDFVLIANTESPDADGAKLFVQPDDPWLMHNVAAEYPDVVRELKELSKQLN